MSRLPENLKKILDIYDKAYPGAVPQEARGVGGAAWVETSRGLLAHVVAIEDGRIARYRILAPTEWNFHPDGPFARGLAGTEADSEAGLRRALHLQALALDPCVAYEAVVDHA